eukprot:TRINITY_DN65957_c10_g1_i2.p1 TRINITY_DN65957_c10_g1~~TRINITY_DN65957_c10_g1_i2.p1  ORF type:complete len:646 (-),score=373.40 TRINITY_DN65957_c10_g1_i2:245-2182(-)
MCQWLGCSCEPKEDRQVAGIVKYEDRSCTDLLFLIAYFAFWIVIVSIFSSAVEQGGDPDKIIRAVDYKGRICGKSTGVVNQPLGAWPHPLDFYKFKVCVADCSATFDWSTNTAHPYYFDNTYNSTKLLFYCVPTPIQFNTTVKVSLSGDFESTSEDTSRAIGDLFTAWVIILASAFFALIFSFIYVHVMERFAGCLVFVAILLTAIFGFVLGYSLLQKASDYEGTQLENRAKVVKGMGITVLAATFLFVIIVIALRKRIKIAIAVVKEASKAVSDMRALMIFPIVPFFIGCGFVVWWISVALYIMSVTKTTEVAIPSTILSCTTGNTAEQCGFDANDKWVQYEWNEDLKRSFGAHFFSLLWNVQFLIYFTYMVIAGAIADWYFTPWDGQGKKVRGEGEHELTNSPVSASAKRTFRFHLGTIALGSMIIAIIQFIRAVVAYLEAQAKEGPPNRLKQCIFCLIKCCLWCAECCMDKISKNAFIWTAIWGDNFGTAACSSFQLIWRNLARVAAIEAVGAYLMVVGKVLVALVTTGFCAIIMNTNSTYKEELSSIIMPCFVIFIISLFVASLFMTIFETTIDTTFICFLVDEEHNKGGKMLASPELVAIVDKFAGDSEEHAKRTKSLRNQELQTGRVEAGDATELGNNK